MVARVTWLLSGNSLWSDLRSKFSTGVNPGARDEKTRRGEQEAEKNVCDTHFLRETETMLTRADIDENFANKADWIHQIEESVTRTDKALSVGHQL